MSKLVLKIGGSVLYDEKLSFNIKLIEQIVNWFEKQKDYENVVFVVGGGKLSRFLLDQMKEKIFADLFKHQVGIGITRVNVTMVFGLFNSQDVKCFDSLEKLFHSVKNNTVKGFIVGGITEGWSTDMVSAHIAKDLGINVVNKISDIDYIYDVDPNLNKDAKPLKSLTWEEYIHLFHSTIGEKHEPGMSAPIDIKCSQFCQKYNIAFRVSGGTLLKQGTSIEDILKLGTLVS